VLFPQHGRIDWFALVLAVIAFAGLLRWKWNVVAVVTGGALAGLLWRLLV
jgi:hypothetical protein